MSKKTNKKIDQNDLIYSGHSKKKKQAPLFYLSYSIKFTKKMFINVLLKKSFILFEQSLKK